MVMVFTLMLKETDTNLKTMKTKKIQDSFEENFMEGVKLSLRMEINILEISKMENVQDGVKWSTKILKLNLKPSIQEFMKDIGSEASETVMEKCHGLMEVCLKVNGSLIKESLER